MGQVFDAVEHVVTFGLAHRTLAPIDAIGVDEIQYSKGHKYLTLVYQIDPVMTRLLWIGRVRTIESFQGFFTVIGDELASRIVFVCSDMWQPYLKVIREKCSQALHILDRFHIVAKVNLALDDVRAEESNRMRLEGRMPLLKKSRWLLLRREPNLKDDQRFQRRRRGPEQQSQSHHEKSLRLPDVPSPRTRALSLPLANRPSRKPPTIFSDQSFCWATG
jgi:transposase